MIRVSDDLGIIVPSWIMRCVIKWLVSRHGGGVTFLILEMAGWHLKRDAPFFYRRSDLGVQGQLELDRSSMVRGPIALV